MFSVDSVECPRRRQGWSQVADGRCSQAGEQTHPGVCVCVHVEKSLNSKATRSFKAEFDCSSWWVLRGPVLLQLSCGLVREGSPLLAEGWNYNPRRKGGDGRGGKKKSGREVLHSPGSLTICLKTLPSSCLEDIQRTNINQTHAGLITMTFNIQHSQSRTHTHFSQR